MTENDSFPSGLVMARFFERPRCRPWDLVKGRRYRCCHALTSEGHGRGCMTGVTVHIPKHEELP
ncbi:hypothetical protein LCGC14_2312090 [marine sediment metagenome]|uniref:Uncharacterized protein n=1 Tax=marine sediment metagenome TaxID=412755 RepID=A0A0F9EXT3_9ZZZZ